MQNKLCTLFLGITAGCLLVLILCLAVAGLYYVPKINASLKNLDKLTSQIDSVNSAVDSLIIASNELKKVNFEDINALVDESRKSVASANKKIEDIDIDTLNEAIKNLNDTVGPLAEFFNVFG